MHINNIDKIVSLIQDNDLRVGDFYYLQIIKRYKDNHKMKKNVILKNYMISDVYQLRNVFPEIEEICRNNNARCYFYVNKKNIKNISHLAISDLALRLNSGNEKSINEDYFSSIICRNCSEERHNQKFIIDIDTKDSDTISSYIKVYKETCKKRKSKLKYIILDTVNGVHVIAKAFDRNLFYDLLNIANLEHVQIFDDNCTLMLY